MTLIGATLDIAVEPGAHGHVTLTMFRNGAVYSYDADLLALSVTTRPANAQDETLAGEMEELWQRDRHRRERAQRIEGRDS